jgi:hypothetical protein
VSQIDRLIRYVESGNVPEGVADCGILFQREQSKELLGEVLRLAGRLSGPARHKHCEICGDVIPWQSPGDSGLIDLCTPCAAAAKRVAQEDAARPATHDDPPAPAAVPMPSHDGGAQ